MAEKLKEGIGRELRYMEYKLRKRKNDRSGEKKKKHPSYPTMTEPSSSISDEFKDALPSSCGEEQLQMQVALAMSREEVKEMEKSDVSDKIRLEMALKESAEVAAKMVAKNSPNSASNNKTSADPWGTSDAPKASFDPFASGNNTENGFASDAWGKSTTSLPQPGQSAPDPWGSQGTNSADTFSPSAATARSQSLDPWGANPQSSQQSDPWGTSSLSLASAPSTAATAGTDPWNTVSTSSTSNGVGLDAKQPSAVDFDPFQAQTSSAFTPTQNFDPLHEFDKLTLQPPQSAPASSSYTAPDLFSSNIMTPQPTVSLAPTKANGNNVLENVETKKAEEFLGANSDLVNINSLVTKPPSTHPYISLNTSTTGVIGASRNPFNSKGPSKSLNEMKGENQIGFGGQVQAPQPTYQAYPTSMQPSPMTLPPAMTMMGQPGYGMPAVASTNPFAPAPAPQQNNPFPPQNHSLF